MRIISIILFFIVSLWSFSQEERPITTALPFLLLSPDAIASGKADIGVATEADAFSQYWNASKYVFSKEKSAVAMSYTPYLNRLSRDIFLGSLHYFKRNHHSAWGASFRYFNLGAVELTDYFANQVTPLGNFYPTEWTLDVSYNLLLSSHFSMGTTARFLTSNLQLPSQQKSNAWTVAFDISGYYQSEEHLLGEYLGSLCFGFQISNIGNKIKYDDIGKSYFLPTNLKLGGSYSLIFDELNTMNISLELNKLLVPSLSENTSFLQGIFSSFSDAPNGFSEEIHEISWALGLEYVYTENLFLRTGFHYQHPKKGDQKYLALGTGFRSHHWQLDFSYLFSFAQTNHPLSNSLKVSLQYLIR